MRTNEIVRKAIADYYKEMGEQEPKWKIDRNDSWFVQYCKDLNERKE